MNGYITDQRVPLPTSMTLRDYFAAAALTGLFTDPRRILSSPEDFADDAYTVADAMMRARRTE